jgi:hypothetical protein
MNLELEKAHHSNKEDEQNILFKRKKHEPSKIKIKDLATIYSPT